MAFGTTTGGTKVQRARVQAWLYYGRKERRLKQAIQALPPWTSGTVYAAGATVQSNLKQYTTAAGGTAGSTSPFWDGGTANDGGVDWTFVAV